MSTMKRPRWERLPRRAAILAVGLIGGVWSGSSAEILNTLRGFSDDPGWSGDLEAKASVSGGNSEVTIVSGGGFVQWQSTRDRVRLLLAGRQVTDDGDELAESALAHIRHNHHLVAQLHSVLFVQRQTNPFQRLHARTLLGVGVRDDIIDRDGLNAAIGVTHMVEIEEIDGIEGSDTDQRGSFFVTAEGLVTDAVSVDVSSFYQPLWNDFSNSRVFVNGAVRVAIGAGFEFRTAVDVVHDAEPPDGVEKTDWTIASGVGVTF